MTTLRELIEEESEIAANTMQYAGAIQLDKVNQTKRLIIQTICNILRRTSATSLESWKADDKKG